MHEVKCFKKFDKLKIARDEGELLSQSLGSAQQRFGGKLEIRSRRFVVGSTQVQNIVGIHSAGQRSLKTEKGRLSGFENANEM